MKFSAENPRSPYWTIVNKLGQFLSDNYEYELKQIIQNKDNIDNEQFLKTNSGLSFNILYALQNGEFRAI